MSDTPWTDQYTLLCEKCGYVVEGLDTADPCPECGKPIEESLPIERPGTPWQQKHSIINLLRTWYRVLRHPKRTFDEMTSIEQDGISLTAVGLCFAIALTVIVIFIIFLFEEDEMAFGALIITTMVGVASWAITYIYAWIATYRIRVLTRKKYRISSHAAWAIVGHASLGLCLPPIVLILNLLIAQLLSSMESLGIFILNEIYAGVASFLFLASFPIGLIFFEALCWIGVRRCKFRNSTARAAFESDKSDLSDLPEPSQTDTRTT